MKKYYLFFFLLICTEINFSQWTVDHFSDNPFNNNYFSYISVVDSSTVWVVGSTFYARNNILRRNALGNWDSISTNGISDSLLINCIVAKDELNAWVTDGAFFGQRGNAHIYRTTNGGLNWFVQVNTGGQFGGFNGISFSKINPAYGYAWSNPPDSNGTPLKIYKTSNSGANWQVYSYTVDPRFIGTQNSICVTDSMHAWFGLYNTTGMYDYHKILYTTDGGTNFQISHLAYQGYYVNSIEFKQNNQFGIAATDDQYDYLSKSNNGGASWQSVFYESLGNSIKIISIPNTNVWYAATGSQEAGKRMYKSTDNGMNWNAMLFPDSLFIKLTFMDYSSYGNKVYLYAVERNGKIFRLVDNVEVIGINSISTEIPKLYSLSQNYPNPFNPLTKIRFSLPHAGNVRLTVFDALGKEIKLLVNENLQAGIYETDLDAANIPSGVYFYRIEADGYTETKKMILLK